MDFSFLGPLITGMKGGGTKEEIKIVIAAYKDLYKEQRLKEKEARKEIEDLKKQLEIVIENQTKLTKQVGELIKLEEKCLKQQVASRQTILNLREQLIFARRELAKLKPPKK